MLAKVRDVARVLRDADKGAEGCASPTAEVGEFRFLKHAGLKRAELQELVIELGKCLLCLGLVKPVKGLEVFGATVIETANSDEHGKRALVQMAFFLENADKPGRIYAGFLAEIAVRGKRVVFFSLDKPVLQVLTILQIV